MSSYLAGLTAIGFCIWIMELQKDETSYGHIM